MGIVIILHIVVERDQLSKSDDRTTKHAGLLHILHFITDMWQRSIYTISLLHFKLSMVRQGYLCIII